MTKVVFTEDRLTKLLLHTKSAEFVDFRGINKENIKAFKQVSHVYFVKEASSNMVLGFTEFQASQEKECSQI